MVTIVFKNDGKVYKHGEDWIIDAVTENAKAAILKVLSDKLDEIKDAEIEISVMDDKHSLSVSFTNIPAEISTEIIDELSRV